MESFETIHMTSYSEIYGKEADVDCLGPLISDIPSLSALEWLSYVYYRKTQLKLGEDEFRMIVMPMMRKFDDETHNILISYFKKIITSNCRFIDGTAILFLTDKILENNNKQTNKLSNIQASNLLKAYLICCDIRLPNINMDTPKSNNNVEDCIRYYLPERLKINEVELIKDYRFELIRFYEFMDFCENNDKYKQYVELLLSTRHCQSWNTYLFDIFHIFINAAIAGSVPTNKLQSRN